MSTPAITIAFTPAAQAVLNRYADLPQRIRGGIAVGLREQNQLTVAHIQRQYLSFSKSSPPVPEGLRVQSNRLRASIRATDPRISGDEITTSIGTNVKYAVIHEFGGVFTVTKKPGTVRLRTDRGGNLLRQGKNGKLAIFAKNTHKSAKEVAFAGSTYTVTYPARAPIRHGIEDCAADYTRRISRNIVEAMKP